jgi:cytochrome c oxidase subunit 2
VNELLRRLLLLPEQASTVSREIDLLHYVVIGTSVIGSLVVAGFAAVFLYRFRRGAHRPRRRLRDAAGAPGDGHALHTLRVPVRLELGMIGLLLAIFLGFWVVGYRQFMHLSTPPQGTVDVYVVGKQWMWIFSYPDGTASNGELHVPVGRPVRLLMTSRDVIHSFFVPAFRVKHDVVPGRMTSLWFEAKRPGTYDVFCTEYCGTDHSRMRARVVVMTPSDYAEAAERRRRETGSLAAIGERTAVERGCLRCHTVDGTPHVGPTWAGLYRAEIPLEGGGTAIADEAYLTESMMAPATRIHRGFVPTMPSYFGILSAGETAAIVEYIKALAARPPEPEPLPAAPLPPEVAP